MIEKVLMKILFEKQVLLMAVVMGSKFLPEVTLKKN
jgi:hypothetical protein